MKLAVNLSPLTAQPVIFKLLSTFRLVVDGQPEAAQKIGKDG